MTKRVLALTFLIFSCKNDKDARPNISSSSGSAKSKSYQSPDPPLDAESMQKLKMAHPLMRIIDPVEKLRLQEILASVGLVAMPNGNLGTGICVGNGLVVTAYHVARTASDTDKPENDHPSPYTVFWPYQLDRTGILIEPAPKLAIMQFVRSNNLRDLALYEFGEQDFSCRAQPFADKGPEIGDLVYRFGFNQGIKWTLGIARGTELEIVVSPGGSTILDKDRYEMPGGFGASGGPIISASGLLLGMTTQVNRPDMNVVINNAGRSGFEYRQYVYAVPIDDIKEFLKEDVK